MPNLFLNTVKILLGPILLIQGKIIRQNTLIMPEPIGPRSGCVGVGNDIKLLIIGDSSALGIGSKTQQDALLGTILASLQKDYRVSYHLLAWSGITTSEIIDKISTEVSDNYDVVLTAIGVNDVTGQEKLSNWLELQNRLRVLIKQKFCPSVTLISGLPPISRFPALPEPLRWFLGSQARVFDMQLATSVKAEQNVKFIPLDFVPINIQMAEDGLHPSPAIYKLWGIRLAEHIRELIDR